MPTRYDKMLRWLASEIAGPRDTGQPLSMNPRVDTLLDWVVRERAWQRHIGGEPARQELYRAEISLVAEAYVEQFVEPDSITEEAIMEQYESDFGGGGYRPDPYPVDTETAVELWVWHERRGPGGPRGRRGVLRRSRGSSGRHLQPSVRC